MALQCDNCNCIVLPRQDNSSFSHDCKWTHTKKSDLKQPWLLFCAKQELIFSLCTGPSPWSGHAHVLASLTRKKFNNAFSSPRVFIFHSYSKTHRPIVIYKGRCLFMQSRCQIYFFSSNEGSWVPAIYKTHLASSSNKPRQVSWSLTSGMLGEHFWKPCATPQGTELQRMQIKTPES